MQHSLQVKVWLGENQDHYYVLSRFLISRMLTVTKVPMNKVRSGPGVKTPPGRSMRHLTLTDTSVAGYQDKLGGQEVPG